MVSKLINGERKVIRRLCKLTVFAIFSCCSSLGFAWDGSGYGAISSLDVVGGAGGAPGNYDFRVFLMHSPVMCSSGSNWAFINSTDANYRAIVSTLTTAFALGKSVSIYTILAQGQCQIGYVSIVG